MRRRAVTVAFPWALRDDRGLTAPSKAPAAPEATTSSPSARARARPLDGGGAAPNTGPDIDRVYGTAADPTEIAASFERS
ncbi:MAG: hypothetical protein ABIY58_04290, partial [Acidimicrobiales bacterium]